MILAVLSAWKRLMIGTRIWTSAVWLSGSDAFSEGFQAAHLGLDPATGMVSDLKWPYPWPDAPCAVGVALELHARGRAIHHRPET